jgi:hypothetical protein
MKKFIPFISILAMIASFLMIVSVSTGEQVQKPLATKETPKPPIKPLPPGPSSLPDLKVNKVWIGKVLPGGNYVPLTGDPMLGDQVRLVCEYSNIGVDRKCAGFFDCPGKIGLYIDGQLVGWNGIGELPSGGNQTETFLYKINKEGIHKFECVLDYENKITEQTKSNNKMAMTYKVAVTDAPSYGPGTNLRVTNLPIDQASGYVVAMVENLGSPMTWDAKIRLYFNNVQMKECVWPKTVNKMICSKYAFEPNDPPPKCNWGKIDVKVHAQIIAGTGEHEADKSGKYKEGMLYARQDLMVDHFTKDPGNRLQVVFRNKGICDSSTWSYKVYKDGVQLIQTKGPLGSLKAGGISTDTLNPQPPQGTASLKVEVVPTNPEYELRSDNNSYSAGISGLPYNPSAFDLTVTDIKLRGETPEGRILPPDNASYYTIIPIIKNISYVDMPAINLKFETFVDGVSSGERDCSTSLDRQQEFTFGNYCNTGVTLPPGTHTVKFQIKTNDAFGGNNVLTKTMFRP